MTATLFNDSLCLQCIPSVVFAIQHDLCRTTEHYTSSKLTPSSNASAHTGINYTKTLPYRRYSAQRTAASGA
jgi:hypothetical protein